MVPLFSSGNIYWLALAQVGCTFLLTSFAYLSTPDYPLLLLLLCCFVGNYAWIQHIELGFGSDNALIMFKVAMVVAGSGLIVGFYRRWKYPEVRLGDKEPRKAWTEGWKEGWAEGWNEATASSITNIPPPLTSLATPCAPSSFVFQTRRMKWTWMKWMKVRCSK